MNERHRAILAAAVLSLSLVGCTAGPSTSLDDASDEPSAIEGADAVEESAADDQMVTQNHPVLSDKDVMASMSCVELDEEGLERLRHFGWFDRAVSVKVGEVDGTTWWVVAAEREADGGLQEARYEYLTDALGREGAPAAEWLDFDDATWIELESGSPWKSVDWDHDQLVRGQSALTLARETLSKNG